MIFEDGLRYWDLEVMLRVDQSVLLGKYVNFETVDYSTISYNEELSGCQAEIIPIACLLTLFGCLEGI